MTNLHLIIILTCVHSRITFVIYDINTVYPNQFGITYVDTYLKSLDPFYRNYGNWRSCDDWWNFVAANKPCDLEVYSRSCIMKQEFIGKRTLNSYIGFHKRSFTINKERKITYHPENTRELNCGQIARVYYPQTNYIYLTPGQYKELSRVEGPYSNVIQSTNFAGDHYFYGNKGFEDFGIYNIYVTAINTVLQSNVLLRVVSHVSVFNSEMLEEYIIFVKCAHLHYGKTCWFRCQDNMKITCNCKFSEYYTTMPCNPVCKPGWIPSYITSKVGSIDETLTNCYIMDICNSPIKPPTLKCNFPEECLPVSNSTNLCEVIYAHINPFNTTDNLTSDVFYSDEMIHISFETFWLKEPLVAVNTTVGLISTEEVFEKNVLDLKHEFSMPTFIVSSSIENEEQYRFTIVMELKAWNRYINRSKTFRINYCPTEINLFHVETHLNVETYIYIGEYLFFNSTARPVYRVVNFWRMETINYTLDFGTEIPVATDYLGLAKISCRSILVVKSRTNPRLDKNFTVVIKPFVFFEWNASNNVLEYGSVIKCHSKAFIAFDLKVWQISGISVLSEQPDFISLSEISGGKYEIMCFFTTKMHITFSKLISFKLRVFPTEVCLFLYANIRGSVVQCGHNGFIYDEYKVKVYFLTIDYGDLEIKAEGIRHIRIPYFMAKPNYKIFCNITNVFDSKRKISYSITDKLSTKTIQSYTVSRLNKICLKFEEYVEIPKFSEFSNFKVRLDHHVFFFSSIFQSVSSGLVISVLAVATPLIGFVSVFIILRRVSNKGIKMSKNNNALIKKSRLRTLNDRVRIEVAKLLLMDNSLIGNFYKGQSFSWTHSSSYYRASVMKRM